MDTQPPPPTVDGYAAMRARMVEQQLTGRGISDPSLLKVMNQVPRELFVPQDLRRCAYTDHPLPIGHEQTISQPYVVALMTEALNLTGPERVLEIGTGSGYQAAVLSLLCCEVFSIERIEPLAQHAMRTLKESGFANVQVRIGDGTLGWPEQAPFEGIIVTAGGPGVPDALKGQLAVGGRLVIPVGNDQQGQDLLRLTRLDGDRWATENLGPVRFVRLIGEQGWPSDLASRDPD